MDLRFSVSLLRAATMKGAATMNTMATAMTAAALALTMFFGLTTQSLAEEPPLEPVELPQSERYAEDFDVFWRFVDENYAYFEDRGIDWAAVRETYRPRVESAGSDRTFISLLESAIGELYDSHAILGVNTSTSPRLIPSGTDLWARWEGDAALITDVRQGSSAEVAGLRPGMRVVSVDGHPVAEVVAMRKPLTLVHPNTEARNWVLRNVLAGERNSPAALVTQFFGTEEVFRFVPGVGAPESKVSLKTFGEMGYVRFHNSLGDTATIAALDSALVTLQSTAGLVLDLRDTPGGGNTTVARGIMSRFIKEEQPYQRHEFVGEERATGVKRSWVEIVTPRGPFSYDSPVVVLVGHWTGSMGEGIAIGMDALGATVAGTAMARLKGAVYQERLPNTGFTFNLPVERLTHVNGTAREDFVPPVLVDPSSVVGEDLALEKALSILRLHATRD